VCDLSYTAQVEMIVDQAVALTALMPHLEEGKTLPTVDDAVTEFQQWLVARQEHEGADMPVEDLDLIDLIGVRRG
jgi:hypothetical protein